MKVAKRINNSAFASFLTMVVMVPIMFIVLALIGNELGNLLSALRFGITEAEQAEFDEE